MPIVFKELPEPGHYIVDAFPSLQCLPAHLEQPIFSPAENLLDLFRPLMFCYVPKHPECKIVVVIREIIVSSFCKHINKSWSANALSPRYIRNNTFLFESEQMLPDPHWGYFYIPAQLFYGHA